MEQIKFDDYAKVQLKVALVLSAERVEGSDKLIKLSVDSGERNEAGEMISRQVVAGIGKKYEPEALLGKRIVIVANLEPRSLMGLESQGMILAAGDGEFALLTTDSEVVPGSLVH